MTAILLTSQQALDLAQAQDLTLPTLSSPETTVLCVQSRNVPPTSQTAMGTAPVAWMGVTRILVTQATLQGDTDKRKKTVAEYPETRPLTGLLLSMTSPALFLTERIVDEPLDGSEAFLNAQGVRQALAWVTGEQCLSLMQDMLKETPNQLMESVVTLDGNILRLSPAAKSILYQSAPNVDWQYSGVYASAYWGSKIEPITESILVGGPIDPLSVCVLTITKTTAEEPLTASVTRNDSDVVRVSTQTEWEIKDYPFSLSIPVFGIYCMDITEDLIKAWYARSLGQKTVLGVPNIAALCSLSAQFESSRVESSRV